MNSDDRGFAESVDPEHDTSAIHIGVDGFGHYESPETPHQKLKRLEQRRKKKMSKGAKRAMRASTRRKRDLKLL